VESGGGQSPRWSDKVAPPLVVATVTAAGALLFATHQVKVLEVQMQRIEQKLGLKFDAMIQRMDAIEQGIRQLSSRKR
jgi:hypothetical protein